MVHVLLKPGLENFEHYLGNVKYGWCAILVEYPTTFLFSFIYMYSLFSRGTF